MAVNSWHKNPDIELYKEKTYQRLFKVYINQPYLYYKHVHIITFMDKTKALSKKIEIDKNQLSPYRPKKRKNTNQNNPNEGETPKRQ